MRKCRSPLDKQDKGRLIHSLSYGARRATFESRAHAQRRSPTGGDDVFRDDGGGTLEASERARGQHAPPSDDIYAHVLKSDRRAAVSSTLSLSSPLAFGSCSANCNFRDGGKESGCALQS